MEMEYENVKESADYLRGLIRHPPALGIICGSGLSQLGELIEDRQVFPYDEIPNFPVSTAPGHKSRILFGLIHHVPVMIMQGRFHLYEGYSIYKCAMPVRVMSLLGVKVLIATNAAGGLSPDLKSGDIMLLRDHVNLQGFAGINPLASINDERFGPRFFLANDAYNKELREIALSTAKILGMDGMVKEGVYTMMGGPNFETPAELKLLKILGIDAVGMSTIHEVLTARHAGITVLAFSLITNVCVTEDDPVQVNGGHDLVQEVFDTAHKSQQRLQEFVSRIIARIGDRLLISVNGNGNSH